MTGRAGYFFDLGGTLLALEDDEIHRDHDGRVRLLPGVEEALRALKGTPVMVATNQSGIEKGILTTEEIAGFVAQINDRCDDVVVDFWACPGERSAFRKPSPLMVQGLADKHFIDLARSTMVGDSSSDRACASRAGVGTFVWAREYFGWP